MPEFLQEFLSWYLAPWRRIDRKTFGIALTLATVPSIIIMCVGFGSGSGFLAPLMGLTGAGGGGSDQQALSGMSNADLQLQVEKMRTNFGGAATPDNTSKPVKPAKPEPARGIDWGGIFNNLCLLAMVPLSRMRLRDMGWFGWQENVLTVLFNISVVGSLIECLCGYDIVPFSGWFGFINFGGYAWLSMAKGQPREAVFEKVPTEWQPTQRPPDERF